MHSYSLLALLEAAVKSSPSCGLVISAFGNTKSCRSVSYQDLLIQAQYRSGILQRIEGFEKGAPVLMHLDEYLETFIWFWAVLYADAVPVLTAPFSNIAGQRQRYIQGLANLLQHPICITRTKLLELFDGQDGLNIRTTESLLSNSDHVPELHQGNHFGRGNDDLAILMLTSGSTGTPKAVRLSHRQIFSAVVGKVSFRELPVGKPFLNWIGLDLVASITEIHLTAMYIGVDQVHLYASDVVSNPLEFLTLLSRYQVARTFAPNFFLAKLVAAIRSQQRDRCTEHLDLSNLTWLGSGGEANDVGTCTAVSELLATYGAPTNVIVPGFGMTETCAGAIYNLDCPEYDVRNQRAFTSLGKCIPGVEMRVTLPSDGKSVSLAMPDELGILEVRGSLVFDGYYNNIEATREAFTCDGWFRTGDQATIDSEGNLNLAGRAKETINTNGVKFLLQDIETLLEQALGTRATRVICFPYRAPQSQTEQVCSTYVIENGPIEDQELVEIHDTMVQLVMLHTSVRPYVIALNDESQLPKSTLGKVSRARMRTMFEGGHFAEQAELQDLTLQNCRRRSVQFQANQAERLLLEDFSEILGIDPLSWGLETPIFEMGVTSIDLIRLKQRIGDRLGVEIPIITLMLNPTTRSMARALQDLNASKTYNPVVPLRQEGTKTPLWLVHPGVGEVLVFLGLSQLIHDRPIYALRARGFDGSPYFSSINETVTTYHAAIKQTQPAGPYALAGYSFGTMLAFEIAKRLELNANDEVRFLGSFNLPPHIQWRMRQLDWTACLLHLCYFLGLMPEWRSDALSSELRRHQSSRESALSVILTTVDVQRMAELSLDAAALANWADLTNGLQTMAVDYEPGGAVGVMDVFYAQPLSVSAQSKEEWLTLHLSKWADFCRTMPRFHEVGGAHYTMLSPEHVQGFAKKLGQVLEAREL